MNRTICCNNYKIEVPYFGENVYMSITNPSVELHPKLLGTTGLNISPSMTSASRLQMFSSHIRQTPPINNPTPRRAFTGLEPKYGQYTHGVRLEHDTKVLKIISRYPRGIGQNAIKKNPETLVIYEYEKEINGHLVREVNCASLMSYHAMHQQFGFEFKEANKIQEFMPAGTQLTKSPNIDEYDDYLFGRETEVAMITDPNVIEDGIVISESFCDNGISTGITTYTIFWGTKKFPLNIYGDDTSYKIHPDIGETIGDDGILMTLRRYNEDTAPVHMSAKSLQRIDFNYDERIYAPAGAEIIDIKIMHDERKRGILRNRPYETPNGMFDQSDKYRNAQHTFYSAIVNTYKDLYSKRRDTLRIHPNFHRYIVEALGMTTTGIANKISREYRGKPLDEWQMDITIKYPIRPTVSSKLTGSHGDKGIAVRVAPDHEMPVDMNGNRADIIMEGLSTIKRMNITRFAEQYINACSRDLTKRMRDMASKGASDKELSDLLVEYCDIINPKMSAIMIDPATGMIPRADIDETLNSELGIRVWIRADNEYPLADVCRELRDKFPATYGPVTYVDTGGNRVTTKNPVLIGSMYMLLLEKIGTSWSGVASSKLNLFGVPAKITTSDKYTSPGRRQPIRFGESEDRLFVAFVGSRATADLSDRTNNPIARKLTQEGILTADQPTNIPMVYDREVIKSGNGRIHEIIRHIGRSQGWQFTRHEIKR